jgi:hypothetical protein
VQSCHASIAAARELVPPEVVHPNLVLCVVPDEPALLALADKLKAAGVDHRVFREADMGDAATALASQPVSGKARKLFQKLPLYRAA